VSSFVYDSLGRLIETREQSVASCSFPSPDYGYFCASGSGFDDAYEYDEAGNRDKHWWWTVDGGCGGVCLTSQTTNYDLGNRIVSSGNRSWSDDADGNVTNEFASQSGFATRDAFYSWSSDGRLTQVHDNVAGQTVQYDYNAFGQLVRRRQNGVADRHFLWDQDQLLVELDGTATQRIGEYAYWPGVDQPLAIVTGGTGAGTVHFYAQDYAGNVIGAFSGGVVQLEISTSPWGSSSATGAIAGVNRLQWKGLIWEGDGTQLYYMRHRWYNPRIGRFMSEDPLGVAAGPNLYTFAGNDPVNGFDPSGLRSCEPFDCDGDAPDAFHNGRRLRRPGLSWCGLGAGVRGGADLAVGMTPGVSTAYDFITLVTGRNILGCESVGWGGRGIALIGLAVPGISAGQIRAAIAAGDFARIIFTRFGDQAETLTKLAGEAAAAEKGLKEALHGVSIRAGEGYDRVGKTATGQALADAGFEIVKTGRDLYHFTVVLSKPVTQAIVDAWNKVWGW
jgi:RHS repeat-associated protein